MRLAGHGALVLLVLAGCYNWSQVPSGVHQYTLDLPVGGLTQRYTVVEPQATATAVESRHPAVVVLHSGFSGDEIVSAQLARRLAQRGVVTVLPAYRGQLRRLDGKRSEGKIEFCSGEVDDAQAALQWLRSQPGVDGERLAALGSSHGGCIALRLGEREPALRAVVTFSAPVAAAPLVRHLNAHPDQTFFYNGILAAQLSGYIQAAPGERPERYEERSPLSGIERLRMPLLIIHGTQDRIVPLTQACWLYQLLMTSGRTVHERWVDAKGTVLTPAAGTSVCPQAAAIHSSTALSARTEFLALEEQDHFYAKQPKETAQELAIQFLLQELRR